MKQGQQVAFLHPKYDHQWAHNTNFIIHLLVKIYILFVTGSQWLEWDYQGNDNHGTLI